MFFTLKYKSTVERKKQILFEFPKAKWTNMTENGIILLEIGNVGDSVYGF